MNIFIELADNGPSGYRRVVGINSRKGSHLGVIHMLLGVLLIGWWDWSKSMAVPLFS